MNNPYAPPVQHGPSRPGPVKPAGGGLNVLAWIMIIFGGLGLLSAPMTLFTRELARDPASRRVQAIMWEGEMGTWMQLSLVLGTLLAATLLASGIGSLKRRPWARKLGIGYGIATIVMAVLNQIVSAMYLYPALQAQMEHGGRVERAGATGGMIGGMAGAVIGLILPIAVLVMMTRPGIKAQFEEPTGP